MQIPVKAVPFAEVWRGDMIESLHDGHAVVCGADGQIVMAWGDPEAVIYPRSSCKMIQALPLIESGASEAFKLSPAQLALACASHQGAPLHVNRINAWLADMGMSDDDFRCGPQMTRDTDLRDAMIRAGDAPCQVHNNCSGKHAGFLTLNRHLGGNAEYVAVDHPVQLAAKQAFEEVTEVTSPGYGIDGCSAPNHATTLHGLARAMAMFASAHTRSDTRSRAAAALTQAMMAYPELVSGEQFVSGESGACTVLMRAMGGKVAVKTGAEGVFVAILPEQQLGVALKIVDGATRASECAIVALLVKLGALDPAHPVAQHYAAAPMLNRRNIVTGFVKPSATLRGAAA